MPADAFVIRDVKTLKAIADPLRHQLLGLLDKPRTVRELAERVGRPADRLYYHLGLLEQHGIITADEQRGADRRYRHAHEHVIIDPDLTMPPGVAAGLVGGILQRAHREYAQAASLPRNAGKRRSMVGMDHLRLTEADRAELARRLRDLMREYEGREGDETFGVLVGIWPVADDRDEHAPGDDPAHTRDGRTGRTADASRTGAGTPRARSGKAGD